MNLLSVSSTGPLRRNSLRPGCFSLLSPRATSARNVDDLLARRSNEGVRARRRVISTRMTPPRSPRRRLVTNCVLVSTRHVFRAAKAARWHVGGTRGKSCDIFERTVRASRARSTREDRTVFRKSRKLRRLEQRSIHFAINVR